jgi:multidrug transporter EmrE-like cation transporter
MSPVTTIVLTTLAAFLFMAASWVMKTLSQSYMLLSIPLIFLIMGLAVWVEIEVLRATRMGHVLVMMLAIELLMTFAVACFFLKERYTLTEFTGVAVILFGMVVLTSGKSNSEVNTAETQEPRTTTILPKQVTMPTGATLTPRQTFKTSTPGKTFPSIHSRNAPPAVEI